MRYAVVDLATEETRRAISAHLEALHDTDAPMMVVFGWWRDGVKLDEREIPSKMLYDVPDAPPGATHLTIEGRIL